ncbi:MAG: glycosyltransferase family 4 protein [Bdellovibrionales bacterium]|nr:glycosyltransferase family 4 protein [Bdellovibrionales bacterium]
MLRVLLDLRPTEPGFKAHAGRGTGRYTSELSARLLRLAEGDPSIEIIGLKSSMVERPAWEERVVNLLPAGKRTFESQVLYPNRVAAVGADIVHFFSHGDAPARAVVPQIVTVLDLIPLRFPDLYRADKPNLRFQFARWMEHQAIRCSTGVLAISEATKRDCVELLGLRAEDIVVTPLAVSDQLLRSAAYEASRRDLIALQRGRLGLPQDRPLLLYIGGIDPRKNVLFLLDVFADVLAQWRPDTPRPLLLLGGAYEQDDQYPKLVARQRALGLQEHVRLLGYVPDDSLAALYQSADLFLFPSLYEGFGLPVLEALACGTPVVAGDNSSLPEVVGGAGMLLADNDQRLWVTTVLELLSAPEELTRLSDVGIRRARLFSWERTSEATLAAYHHFAATASSAGGKVRAEAAGEVPQHGHGPTKQASRG